MHILLSFLLAALSFGSPVHIPVELAGNFGEPRPNHFHGGIDVKTNREVNLGVYSIADGYISGAVVQKHGYGLAIYVAHPNGYTSQYFHLNKFVPQIEAAVRKYQYNHHSYAVDVKFAPGEFPVRKGQLIALSGNTGASKGPHIHIEYHETKTGNMTDPLNALKGILKDKTPPAVYSFKVYPQAGEGVFQHSQSSRIFTFDKGHFLAWGKVGFGVRANDHMDDVYNSFGVRYTKLYCDNRLIFYSDVNNIPVIDNRMINSWGDYDHFISTHIWYLKSFIDPGNRLPILKAVGRGIINFNEPREYHLRYELSDVYGNTTIKKFTVLGNPEAISHALKPKKGTTVYYNRYNNVYLEGCRVSIKRGLLANNGYVVGRRAMLPLAYSPAYSFSTKTYPLFGWTKISIKLDKNVCSATSKLYIAALNGLNKGGAPMYCGGIYKDGWVTGRMRDLGLFYYLAIDNEAPHITEMSLNPRHLFFRIFDRGSGMKSYQAYVDDKFVLFSFGKNKEIIFCDLADTPIHSTGKEHTLKIIATDNRDNERVFTTKVRY